MNNIKNLFSWLDGGFNLPTEAQVDKAPTITHPKPEHGFFQWIGGGYNLPTVDQVDKAPNTVVEDNSYPTGIWGWFCGSFNVPNGTSPK